MIRSKKEMCDILRSVRCIGPNNAGEQEAAHLLAEAMKEGVVWEGTDKAALGVLPGGLCGDEYFDVVELGKGTGIGLDSFSLCIEGSEKDGWIDGQQYTVTVTKVEGGSV